MLVCFCGCGQTVRPRAAVSATNIASASASTATSRSGVNEERNLFSSAIRGTRKASCRVLAAVCQLSRTSMALAALAARLEPPPSRLWKRTSAASPSPHDRHPSLVDYVWERQHREQDIAGGVSSSQNTFRQRLVGKDEHLAWWQQTTPGALRARPLGVLRRRGCRTCRSTSRSRARWRPAQVRHGYSAIAFDNFGRVDRSMIDATSSTGSAARRRRHDRGLASQISDDLDDPHVRAVGNITDGVLAGGDMANEQLHHAAALHDAG